MVDPNEFDVSRDGCNLDVATGEATNTFSVRPSDELLAAVANAQDAINVVAAILDLPPRRQPDSSLPEPLCREAAR